MYTSLKYITFICLSVAFCSSVLAGPFTDKLYEFTDSVKETVNQAKKSASRTYRDTKEKISESYQDYRRRKEIEAEKKRRERERINNAVNYYEEQIQKKEAPKVTVKYADPCVSPSATCNTDSSSRKWCWFPGTSKSLCSLPIQKRVSDNVIRDESRVSLRESLKKKRDECRKQVYEEWAKNSGGDQEFASFTLTAALKAKCD